MKLKQCFLLITFLCLNLNGTLLAEDDHDHTHGGEKVHCKGIKNCKEGDCKDKGWKLLSKKKCDEAQAKMHKHKKGEKHDHKKEKKHDHDH